VRGLELEFELRLVYGLIRAYHEFATAVAVLKFEASLDLETQ
jgi:hypothetical protein